MTKKRTVLVTGAAGGIGEAVARIFARSKKAEDLFLTDRLNRQGDLINLANDLDKLQMRVRRRVHALDCDITSQSSIQSLINRITPRNVLQKPVVDILVNIAGIAPKKMTPLVKTDDNEAKRIMEVNYWGTRNMCAAVLPLMQANGYGRIVNVASISACMADPGNIDYSASKAAVVQLTRGLAKEATYNKANPSHPLDITVNAVAPGIVDTDMANLLSEKMVAGFKATAPLGRLIRPEEVAKVIFDLASDDARAITGTVVRVDGGFLA